MLTAPAPLSAWVNPDLHPIGCIGAPSEAEPIAAIAAAEDWLRTQGCTRALGPLDGSTWAAYRANLGPHDRPLFPGEPTADPAPWRASGYTEAHRYSSILADNDPQIAATRSRDAVLRAAGWILEDLTELGDFEAALDVFWQMSLASFGSNAFYTPIDRATFGVLYARVRPLITPPLTLLARSPDGIPGGFCFSYPDAFSPQRREFVIKTLAVVPEFRGLGLGSWLVGETHRIGAEIGFTGGGIHALMAADNRSQRISRDIGGLVREYALFEKALSEKAL
ncbi:MAG: GNAT superfamily N-acetyltransferase [Myxococcota bacterium]|jgi:GNAT superfamily N-acetyltransferase